METTHIRKALKAANLAETSRLTGISVRRLFQLRDGKDFNVTLDTYVKLDKWAKSQKGDKNAS